jgi:hypothetical protein
MTPMFAGDPSVPPFVDRGQVLLPADYSGPESGLHRFSLGGL